jgi:hypothetical protein
MADRLVFRVPVWHAPRIRAVLQQQRYRFEESRPFPWLHIRITVRNAAHRDLAEIVRGIGFEIPYEAEVID